MSGRSRAVIRRFGLKDLIAPPNVRLEGINVEPGRNIIRNCGLNLIEADDLIDPADKATKEGRQWHRRRETDNKGPAK
jgi:succinyl-CoA synthetase beta subunit